jgi:hypothetical protein
VEAAFCAAAVLGLDVEQVMWDRTARQVMTAAAHDLRMRALPVTLVASALGSATDDSPGARPARQPKGESAAEVARRLASTLPPSMARRAFPHGVDKARIVDLERSSDFLPTMGKGVSVSTSGDRRRMGEIVAERIRARRAERGG